MITGGRHGWGTRVRHGWQSVVDVLDPPPLILMYHRIAQDELDPWQLCVSPTHFAAQMACLRRERRPMRLADLTDAMARGCCPRKAVVVTFDDGYRDNLDVALPILERFGVPATVFCTAGAIGRPEGFWWDRLAGLLLGVPRLPSTLVLDRDDAPARFEVGQDGRLAFFREVWAHLRPLPESKREKVLAEISHWCGASEGNAPAAPATLTRDELRALASSGLVDIGAHSVTHPALSSLPIDAQRREIVDSKAQLEHLLGRTLTSFAYPFGNQGPDTAALVREAGFRAACTTEAAAVRAGNDPLQLPRLTVGDWDAATLSALWRR